MQRVPKQGDKIRKINGYTSVRSKTANYLQF